jgi:uncharacterized Tic20 family protein
MSAPGWYPDPNGQPCRRWWDGTQWTDQTQVQQAQEQQTAYAQQAPGWQQGQQAAYPQPYAQPTVMTPDQARQWALFAHLSGLLLGVFGPLIIYLIKKDEDPFVADQSREALNFHLTLMIALFVSIIAIFVIIGIFLLPVVIIGGWVLQIIAAVQANNGVWYRYPLTIRFINS